jgi:hypothetical protein
MFNSDKMELNQEGEIKDLLEKIKKFEENAKKGQSNKRVRNNLLSRIEIVEKSGNKIILNYYNFEPDEKRIKILGAYELYLLKKDYRLKFSNKL